MRRYPRVALLILVFLTLAAGSVLPAAKPANFQQLSEQILQSLQKFYPVRSTEMGIHHYDHRFTDYSSGAVKGMLQDLDQYGRWLRDYHNGGLSGDQLMDYHLLKAEVDMAIHDLKRIKWHETSPLLYAQELVDGLYLVLLSEHAPMESRVVSLTARIRAVPDFLSMARKNLKSPPPVYVEAALEMLETADQFYHEVGSELMGQFPDRADNIYKMTTRARESMHDFADWLRNVKQGDDKSFAIGKRDFEYLLTNRHHLPMDADSLLKLGEALLEDARAAYRKQEEYVFAHHQEGADSVFVPACISKQDLIDYYNWETEQLRIFLEQNDFITVPEEISDVIVVETPPFLRSIISGLAYQPPGPFNEGQEGYFYVRPIPDDLGFGQLAARFRYVHRRGFRGAVVHEAYPGHHLQMQIAGLHPNPVRKWHRSMMFIEGWALYCEEMMYHAGLYGAENPSQWLQVLSGIRFRAARVVADVKLHTGQFTVDECVDWMATVLNVQSDANRDFLRHEVRRYTFQPGYQLTYLMGKREIAALREAVQQRDGDNFSVRDFHNQLLSYGSPPPALLWEAMGVEQPD
jgi:uncharacterized protein (DUF885 family)